MDRLPAVARVAAEERSGRRNATNQLVRCCVLPWSAPCMVDGILICAALTLLGLNFVAVIGAMVVVLTMIPYIGIIICWVPAVLLAAFQWGGNWTTRSLSPRFSLRYRIWKALLYAPRIVGNYIGLYPMTVIVSIFVWGLIIGGVIGLLLAVPVTATLAVLFGRYVWGRRLREQALSIERVLADEEIEVPTHH